LKTPFNKPYLTGNELKYIQEAVNLGKISGNGEFTNRCHNFFQDRYGFEKCLLTTSCTDALEMAAILLNIAPGDEVILPSFTFVSTANAFVLRGAKIIFVDSRPDHPGMDESKIEELITPQTKAIVAVHYAGVACEMDLIMDIANRHQLFVIEDAAQGIDSFYNGKALGGIGHLGTMSFHETKNIQCGEGGMLIINDPSLAKRAEIIWEKGTNRAAFFKGEIDKYGWVDMGSSFLPSEVTAAFLWAQLESLDRIQARRKAIWEDYFAIFNLQSANIQLLNTFYCELLKNLKFKIENPRSSPGSFQDREAPKGEDAISNFGNHSIVNPPILNSKIIANAHLFYLLFPDQVSRTEYANTLKEKGILAVFHYQSLHRSEYARKHFPDQYRRELPNSDRYSDCLLRLPFYYELGE
jgi:dTDP-4-amino-4,6-dideoxygalactose transaminase